MRYSLARRSNEVYAFLIKAMNGCSHPILLSGLEDTALQACQGGIARVAQTNDPAQLTRLLSKDASSRTMQRRQIHVHTPYTKIAKPATAQSQLAFPRWPTSK